MSGSGGTPDRDAPGAALSDLDARITSCRLCPRLVAWREEAARSPRAPFATGQYWARPLPGFGDPRGRLLVVGLAPAAHGGNRTGRMFTGDRSGDFLFAALYRAGFANQATSTAIDDGLRLRDAYVTAPVRCAPPDNRPAPEERRRCAPYFAEELELLSRVQVVLALGAYALDSLWRQPLVTGATDLPARPRRTPMPRFAHGAEIPLPERPGGPPRILVCSYHPSQRNVFTGLLTAEMLDTLLERIRALLA